MQINVVNVIQDPIPMEPRVNCVIRFMQNVQNVQQRLKRVLNVLPDIMSQEETVPHVQVKWQIVLNVPQMEVNVLNVPVDIIQMEPHVNCVLLSQDVNHVPKRRKHAQHVILEDI